MESKTSVDDVVRLCETSRAPERVTGLPTAPERPVIYTAEPDRPQPRLDVMAGEPERAQGMAVVNGRIQVEENIVKFISLSNNLIRGAAGGSVLNAELAYRENRF
jgi:aspartate-semialdehyde dehydrogenase